MATRDELVNSLMTSNASFILGHGATRQADKTIRELLAKALLDEEVFKSEWKKFFKEKG